jgi:hypothetical protein
MVIQALTGLLFSSQYRDVAWIKATWFGNDIVTLCLAVPMLLVSLTLARSGEVRGLLLWLGILGYDVYNYAYYMLGAVLNVFFPLYVVLVVLSAVTLVRVLSAVVPSAIVPTERAFGVSMRVHPALIGGYFTLLSIGLCAVWLAMWAAHVFAGRPTPIETDAFRLVAALDMSLMVPALGIGGVWLWRRARWGLVVCSVAGVQASLYLVVLALNSAIAVYRGLAPAPGELPIWGPLAVFTTMATALLVASASVPRDLDETEL